MMEILHQVTPQLNSCIDLNLGKILNLAFSKNLMNWNLIGSACQKGY